MKKKIIISVMAVLLVGCVGVGTFYFINYLNDNQADDVATPDVQYLDEDMGDEEFFVEEVTEESTDSTQAVIIADDDSLSDNTSDVVTSNFSIQRVFDHTINEEVHPRVVFGSQYNKSDNYIKFDSQGNFQIKLSGYLDDVTVGTYTQYDDIIYVEYKDGTAAEYDVVYDDSGIISHIIVNYGDYDIYFA